MLQPETKSVILARMLSRIDNMYDKNVGSFPYDMEAPVSMELEEIQALIAFVERMAFADTSANEYLDRKVAELGLTRKDETFASGTVTIIGRPGKLIPAGTLVTSSKCQYETTEESVIPEEGTVDIPVISQVAGSIGNCIENGIYAFAVTVDGLYAVSNQEEISNGYDVENDESLRERYFIKARQPATSGNVYHYTQWAMAVTGVGGVKIKPLWAGNGTVKVIIIDSNDHDASDELVQQTADYIEEMRPIGATVTVVSAQRVPITVTADFLFDTGADPETVLNEAFEAIDIYVRACAFEKLSLSYAIVGSLLIDIPGILDYSNLLINGGDVNIKLTDEQIAVLEAVESNG